MDRKELSDLFGEGHLLERMHGAALQVFKGKPNAWEDASDAVQDAVDRALRTLDAWGPKVGPGGTIPYLVTAARNAAKDIVRRKTRGRDLNRTMPLDEMPEPYYACEESDPETVCLSTNPTYALACLIDSATRENRRTALEWYRSEHAAVRGRDDEREARKLRARKARLCTWVAGHMKEINDPSGGLQERITDAIAYCARLTERGIETIESAVDEAAETFRLPERSLFTAYCLHLRDASPKFGLGLHAVEDPNQMESWGCEIKALRHRAAMMYSEAIYLTHNSTQHGPVCAAMFAWAWRWMKLATDRDEVESFSMRKLQRNALQRVLHHIAENKFDSRAIVPLTEA
jgi:DNA-directed RNA polymerase specialized sigma24 family protein